MTNKKPWLYLAAIAALLLLLKYSDALLGGLRLLATLLTPLLLGCAVAYVLNIIVTRIESLPPLRDPLLPPVPGAAAHQHRGRAGGHHGDRGAAVSSSSSPSWRTPSAWCCWGCPPAVNSFLNWLDTLDLSQPQLEEWLRALNVNWPDLFKRATSYLTSGVGNVFNSAVSLLGALGGTVMQSFIALIFALYLLAGKDRLNRQFHAWPTPTCPSASPAACGMCWPPAHDTFTPLFRGPVHRGHHHRRAVQRSARLFRLPYATMIGTLVGATALLPVVGAYLGAGIGAFMILTVNPLQALVFLIFIAVLQQLEGNLIYPRVVGTSIGLPGIWVLAAVTVGGGIGGIAGMLLAVPVTATFYRLLRTDVQRRQAPPAGPQD